MIKSFLKYSILPLFGILCIACKEKEVEVTSIACEEESVTLRVGESAQLHVAALPEDAKNTAYFWEIANPDIVAVENDQVTAKAKGTTWIYAISAAKTKLKDSVKITVMPKERPAQVSVAHTDENISYEGRFIINDESAQYFYPGSSILTTFTGTSLSGVFNKVVAYYWVEIDDQEPFKLFTRSKARWVKDDIFMLAQDLEEGTHTVRITLCSEGIFKNPKFYGFLIDEKATLKKPAEKKTKFEFIGNSITCGYGTEVTDRSKFNDSTSNFCHTYAYAVTKEFDAQLMVVARSGIGVYRNYGDKETASLYGSMPQNYEKAWLQSETDWDFGTYTPDVLFINLGTNDTWEMSSFSTEKYDAEFRSLLTKVYSHYPEVKIVLLTGSMMDGEALTTVKGILDKVRDDYSAAGHTIYRFDFAQTYGTGADWHPCAEQQAKMGADLIKFLKENNVVTK